MVVEAIQKPPVHEEEDVSLKEIKEESKKMEINMARLLHLVETGLIPFLLTKL